MNFPKKGKTQYAEWNFKGLAMLKENLDKNYYVDIGIFQEKDSRTNKGKSDIGNAALGAVQEFGMVHNNTPARSWLRMPITKLGTVYNQLIGSYFFACRDALIAPRGERIFFSAIGKCGVKIIKRAFNSSGFGEWDRNADSTMKKKSRNKPLKDTTQLRDAVKYRISTYGK